MFNNLGNLFKTKEEIEREERIKARRKQRQKAREQAREINQQAFEVQQIGNANAQLYQTQANVLKTQLPPRTKLLDYQRQTNNLSLNEHQEHNDFRLKRKLQDYQYINRNQHIDDVQEEYQRTKHVRFGNQQPPFAPPPPQTNQFNQQSQTSTQTIPVINSPPQTPKTKRPRRFADATTSPYMKDFGTSPFKSPPQTDEVKNSNAIQKDDESLTEAKVYHVSSSSSDEEIQPITYGWIDFSDDDSPVQYTVRKTYSSSSDSFPSDSSSSDTFPNGSPKKKKQSKPKRGRTRKQTNSQPLTIHHVSLNAVNKDLHKNKTNK